jgi:endonuclease/exonuclease/phosphatase family protein
MEGQLEFSILHAYRDAWSLFDQVILSAGLVNNPGGWHYYKAQVFNRPYLIQKTGQYKGYPFRTFDFDNYIAGYSGHFPVYVFLLKSLERP